MRLTAFQSPHYLVKRSNFAEARVSFSRIGGVAPDDPIVMKEIADIEENLRLEKEFNKGSRYWDCFKNGENKMRLRTITSMGVQIFQQASGRKQPFLLTFHI